LRKRRRQSRCLKDLPAHVSDAALANYKLEVHFRCAWPIAWRGAPSPQGKGNRSRNLHKVRVHTDWFQLTQLPRGNTRRDTLGSEIICAFDTAASAVSHSLIIRE